MTPQARLAATVELLEGVRNAALSGGAAADNIIRGYFRQRRYAGAKDRRNITGNIYAILHDHEALLWRVAACDGKVDARALVIAWLGVTGENPETGFTGEGYGAAALDPGEKALCERLRELKTAPPEIARLNCPKWLEASLRARFGDEFAAAMESLNRQAAATFRVNSLKLSRDEVIARLGREQITALPTASSPWGFTLAADSGNLRSHRLLASGAVEVQNEASQIASLLVDARPGMQVLDLCAGAGGKALALAASMENKGQIFAADINVRRLGRLKERCRRAGVRNIQTILLPAKDDAARRGALKHCLAAMDRVVVDAPCSGSGTWRHNPELRLRADAKWLAELEKTQTRLLAEAATFVKPGGRLVYMTCSLLAEENEARIDCFLASHAGWTLQPYDALWRQTLNGPPVENLSRLEGALQLGPAKSASDGFFLAILGF